MGILIATILLGVSTGVSAKTCVVTDSAYGAHGDGQTDDTLAIQAALDECGGLAEGGHVFFPAGTYIIARQGSESPILSISSNTTVYGEGDNSILKFHEDVNKNKNNFWRMLGFSTKGTIHNENIAIRHLHLDGSNTFTEYGPDIWYPEHNHGIWFYNEGGTTKNILIERCLIENFSGDCVAVSKGSQNVTIRHIRIRNHLRQGVQIAGDEKAHTYHIHHVQSLPSDFISHGTSIHVEHARGLKNVLIENNFCLRSLVFGSDMTRGICRRNIVHGSIYGNRIAHSTITKNIVYGDTVRPAIQYGMSENITINDNTIIGEKDGIYVWGRPQYSPDEPSRNIRITNNRLCVKGKPIKTIAVEGELVIENNLEECEGMPLSDETPAPPRNLRFP